MTWRREEARHKKIQHGPSFSEISRFQHHKDWLIGIRATRKTKASKNLTYMYYWNGTVVPYVTVWQLTKIYIQYILNVAKCQDIPRYFGRWIIAPCQYTEQFGWPFPIAIHCYPFIMQQCHNHTWFLTKERIDLCCLYTRPFVRPPVRLYGILFYFKNQISHTSVPNDPIASKSPLVRAMA